MPELLMMKGLPGSGKSTLARDLVEKKNYVRTNKDDLRAMLHNSKHSKSNEKSVLVIRDAIIADALSKGRNVVCDDTNFAPQHEQRLRDLAREHRATFRVELVDTPLEVCIERDLKRLNSVGEKVIRGMWNQYLKPAPAEPPAHDPALPNAILCDIDGTLAHMNGRGPYDWHRVGEDDMENAVNDVIESVANYLTGTKIVLMSGRDAVCRPETEAWLAVKSVGYDALLMRPEGDMRKDSIVKRELYEQHIRGTYNVKFVLDDRNQVVDMWRDELGLKCLQVAPGDF